MPLIPRVGRNSAKMRALVAAIYAVLSLGAVSMVYPFLVMLGASVTSQYDQDRYDILPRYLRSDRALFGKYVEDKFGGDFGKINASYGTDFAKWGDVVPPASGDPAAVRAWNTFAASLPARFKTAGFGGDTASYSPSLLLDRYRDFLQAKFHGDIQALDRSYTQEDASFLTVFPPFEQPTKRTWTPDSSAKSRDWADFQKSLPTHFFFVTRGDAIYQQWLKEEAYPTSGALNKAWDTRFSGYGNIHLGTRPTGNAVQRRDWETFVRTKMPFRDVRVASAAVAAYRRFLQGRYKDDVARYNAKYGTHAASFSRIALPDPDALPSSGPPLLDWLDFLQAAPLSVLSADTPDSRWERPLGLAAEQADWAYVRANGWALRWDFLERNYRLAAQYMLLHGHALANTFVFCVLLILTTLIVNPLCAYALSRYNLSYGNSVLLFLLATLAFPTEVTVIPNFLLLKQLHLLNTFGALILPGIANGFSIFLMKGFFDSLPKELYEAGTLDGASEGRMFWDITLPLSKPIFAVIGLGAFTAAYTAFMFALVVCQDPRMWTLMVWIYELGSSGAPQYVMMAAATLLTLPTLLVFLLAQNTIMKGIILPSYK